MNKVSVPWTAGPYPLRGFWARRQAFVKRSHDLFVETHYLSCDGVGRK